MNVKSLLACLSIGWLVVAPATAAITPEQLEFFEKKIRPILVESCYQCHNSVDKKKGDLALDWRDPLLAAKVIVPGKPAQSPLIKAIRHLEDYEPMPSKSPKLANIIIKNFEDWIAMGAPDPRLTKPTKEELASQVDWAAVRENRKVWWSFQSVKKATPPKAADPAWNRSAIDRFIHAKLKTEGFEAQSEAAPGTLVRRLHLILTGLPPKPEVVEAFVADPSDAAYGKLVDDLMATKAYGERWGRYWLDWFRFAESHGSEGDPAIPYASQYRDYVIRAINADVPYDQLVREHLAGDLLEKPRVNKELGLNESAIGTAHLRMVPHGFGVTDAYDEQITFTDNQIDVISKSMLGITVSCARCHNHKFDPISQKDFYKFYGIMVSSRPAIVNVDSPKLRELHKKELAALKGELRAGFAKHWLGEVDAAIGKLEKSKLDKIPDTDPLAAWAKLKGMQPEAIQKELAAMRQRYADGLAKNEKIKAGATYYADLTEQAEYDKWFKSGSGLGAKVSPAGSFAVAPEGGKAFIGIYPAGVYSHLLSDKHNATLSSVFHRAAGKNNSIRAMGSGAMARFVMRSYPLAHGLTHPSAGLKPNSAWVNLGKYFYWNGEKGYYQINTAADATHRGGGSPRSWFGVFEVYAGDESLRDLGTPLVALPGKQEFITDRALLLKFYRASLKTAIGAWAKGSMSDAQANLLNAFVSRGLLGSELAKLPAELRSGIESYRKLEGEIRSPVRAPGVVEGEIWDQPLLAQGNYKNEKEPVERGFLEVFDPGKPYPKSGSGRRELAEDILSERNTLTARVIVNRLWHHTFGRGLVASADNFGRLGKEPSHPELLDYLAADFRAGSWSMKRTVRQLVTSRAFRSASTAPDANGDKDPENLHLAYYTPRRLDAEAIFDTINFVAANSPGPRAVYKKQNRNRLDPFLTTFNLPIPTSTVGVRNLTNVPAQSLTLMNGQTTRQAAQKWSNRVKGDPNLKTDELRIDAIFQQAYSRGATPEEIAACMAYITGKAVDDSAELGARHATLVVQLADLKTKRENVVATVRATLQAEVDKRNAVTKTAAPKAVDLKPIARWDFEGDGKDLLGNMHGTIKGNAAIEGGALVLKGGMMATAPLLNDLKAKTLEAFVQLDPITQRAGGAMTVQTTDGNVFDSIVYAELEGQTWLSGSDRHARTQKFGGPAEKEAGQHPVRMVIVYSEDGTTQAYRDGKPYGKSYKKGSVQFRAGRSQVVFGTRHGTNPSPQRALTGKIFEARLYDRALTADEVAAAVSGTVLESVSDKMLIAALSAEQKRQLATQDAAIAKLATETGKLERQLAALRKPSGAGGDAYFRIAHAILNSKELIYVY